MTTTGSAPGIPVRPTRGRVRRRFVALAVLPTLIGALLVAGGHPAQAQTADLIITPTALTMDEQSQATYMVKLATQPTADVTVTISGHEGTDLTLSTESLTFTRSNYNTFQTVTVTAASDADRRDDVVTLIHSAADGGYGGVSANYVVTVEDDPPGRVLVIPDPMKVDEGGTLSYSVRLKPIITDRGFAGKPTGNVTVTVSGDAGTDVSNFTERFVFTPENWLTHQNGSISAAQDADANNDKVALDFIATGGGFDGEAISVDVTVVDDEPVGVITAISPSSVLMNEAKVSLNIWEATPRTRLHWRYQPVGDSPWTTGSSPKYTNLTGGGEVTSERFTFASRHTVALTGLTAGTTYEIQFALTGDNRTATNETPDFSFTSATKQFSTTSQTIEISISDAASVADEGQGLLFGLARHHAGSYPPGLTVNYRLDVYDYFGGGPNKNDGRGMVVSETTTGTTFFGHRDYNGGLSISTTRDNVCGAQWRARYYKVTLLDGHNYIPKSGDSGWEDGYTIDVEHRTQNCDWADWRQIVGL